MYLRPLAEQNHKKAQGTLGWMYEAGGGRAEGLWLLFGMS